MRSSGPCAESADYCDFSAEVRGRTAAWLRAIYGNCAKRIEARFDIKERQAREILAGTSLTLKQVNILAMRWGPEFTLYAFHGITYQSLDYRHVALGVEIAAKKNDQAADRRFHVSTPNDTGRHPFSTDAVGGTGGGRLVALGSAIGC